MQYDMKIRAEAVAKTRAAQKAAGYKHVSLAIEPDLVKPVDNLVKAGTFKNRKEALNALIRSAINQKELNHAS